MLAAASASHAGIHVFASSFDERPEGPYSKADAARFLTQATFGPTEPEIRRLMRIGYHAWLDEQFAAPPSLQLPYLDGLIHGYIAAGQPVQVYQDSRQEIWWRNALYGQDQLRQRVAFALSQILVISDQSGALEGLPTVLSHYYDMLATQSFGNYRQLLGDVTLHPAMGHYLSMYGNRKPDETLNIRPDENYAREVMQLFSVGLVQLAPDGSVVDGDPDTAGIQPQPTYDQDTIRGFAHVFTGWKFSTCTPPEPSGGGYTWWHWQWCPPGPEGTDWQLMPGWRSPMHPWGEGTQFGVIYHASEGDKPLLDYSGVALPAGVLPAGGTARGNMEAALDNLFEHPNVGPFIGRLLIQRLTTSNPSPAYIERVAAAFADNGSGVRGDLGAVVRAILLDPEARDRAQAPGHFGKLREPLLRVTHLWRALDAVSNSGRVGEGWAEHYTAQAVQRSPTVFNFFLPDYRLPGEVASLGLYSPEFQITTDTYLTRLSNTLQGFTGWAWRGNPWLPPWDPPQVELDHLFASADRMDHVIDRLDLLFMSHGMSMPMFDALREHAHQISIQDVPWDPGGANGRRERIHDVLWLILTSPEYVVER
jgi:uncharacterized protein (DUF1800 family)